MKTQLLPTTPGTINLVIAPHAGIDVVDEVIARLALTRPVRVIDCGNRGNVFPIAKIAYRFTTHIDGILKNTLISRAFTCYQVSMMLAQEPNSIGMPILVIDLLSTFLDEDISLKESHRLLAKSIFDLQRLSQTSPVLITIKPLLSLNADRISLLNELAQAAASTFRFEAPTALPETETQATLF